MTILSNGLRLTIATGLIGGLALLSACASPPRTHTTTTEQTTTTTPRSGRFDDDDHDRTNPSAVSLAVSGSSPKQIPAG